MFESPNPNDVILLVLADKEEPNKFPVHLMDLKGHEGAGKFTLDLQRTYGITPTQTWGSFLERYIKLDVTDDEIVAFSVDLFQALIRDSGLGASWREIQSAAGQGHLLLTVEFSADTEPIAALPLELLHDNENFVFARPGSGIQRALLKTPARHFISKPNLRVLFAWACPAFSGVEFDPAPHVDALTKLFGDRLEVLPQASRASLETVLLTAQNNGQPFDYLHLLAHGYRDNHSGGLCLTEPSGTVQYVTGQRLGATVRNRSLELVFLCSCQTGIAGQVMFSGVAQQLLAMQGGDLPCVIATQANLPIKDSEILVRRFYQLLADGNRPSQALFRARRDAFSEGGCVWSVPVLWARPARTAVFSSEVFVKGLPEKRDTYQPRDVEKDGLEALRNNRLVSLVGLPGIGKTETGKEIARQAYQDHMFDRVIFQEVKPGFTPDLLRSMVATALGQVGVDDDYNLATIIKGQKQKILIVLDNAEDLMTDPASEDVFRNQVNTLLGHTSSLKLFMTTRWALNGSDTRGRLIEVKPMRYEEMSKLLADELDQMGFLQPEWIESEPWRKLIELLDGHPRSLRLICQHFETRPGADPAFVLSRLRYFKEKAIVEPGLFGRPEIYEKLPEDQRDRMRSLVATMDFSFDVLDRQFPDATDLYLGLSLFPSGLPESVALEVAGGVDDSAALDKIYLFHLVAWDRERVYNPVPLQWYAEKQRMERGIDEAKYMRRAVEAFAGYVEGCNQRITSGSILAGVDRLLIEETTLQSLAEWIHTHGDHSDNRSFLGRIANAAANGLLYADHFDTLTTLTSLGLLQTKQMNDRLGEANCLQSLGDLKMRTADLEGARADYDAALPIYRDIRERMGEANCLKSLGDLKMRTADLEGARADYDAALPIYRDIRARMGEANCLQSLGDLKRRTADLEGARADYDAALPIFRDIRDRMGEANCLQSLGDLKMRTADLEGARADYDAALPIYRDIRARMGEANCLQSLGDLKRRTADLEGARADYDAALPIFRDIRDRMGEANCLQSLGDLKMRTDDLEGARADYDAALPIYRDIRDRMGEANCLQSLGDLKMRTDDLEGARADYDAALPIFRDIRARLGEANCLQSLGDLKTRTADLEGARADYDAALPIFRDIKERLGEANCLQSLGDLKMRTADLEGARADYDAALPIFRDIRDRMGEANCLQSQGLLELMENKPIEAFLSFKHVLDIFKEIKDTLGYQSAYGYMAKTAYAASAYDQAILLAEESLKIGRAIHDRFGQTLNLQLQLQIWHERSEAAPMLAAILIMLELCKAMGDQAAVQHYSGIIDQVKQNNPEDQLKPILQDPEAVRQEFIQMAQDRFAKSGRELMDPPVADE